MNIYTVCIDVDGSGKTFIDCPCVCTEGTAWDAMRIAMLDECNKAHKVEVVLNGVITTFTNVLVLRSGMVWWHAVMVEVEELPVDEEISGCHEDYNSNDDFERHPLILGDAFFGRNLPDDSWIEE